MDGIRWGAWGHKEGPSQGLTLDGVEELALFSVRRGTPNLDRKWGIDAPLNGAIWGWPGRGIQGIASAGDRSEWTMSTDSATTI